MYVVDLYEIVFSKSWTFILQGFRLTITSEKECSVMINSLDDPTTTCFAVPQNVATEGVDSGCEEEGGNTVIIVAVVASCVVVFLLGLASLIVGGVVISRRNNMVRDCTTYREMERKPSGATS